MGRPDRSLLRVSGVVLGMLALAGGCSSDARSTATRDSGTDRSASVDGNRGGSGGFAGDSSSEIGGLGGSQASGGGGALAVGGNSGTGGAKVSSSGGTGGASGSGCASGGNAGTTAGGGERGGDGGLAGMNGGTAGTRTGGIAGTAGTDGKRGDAGIADSGAAGGGDSNGGAGMAGSGGGPGTNLLVLAGVSQFGSHVLNDNVADVTGDGKPDVIVEEFTIFSTESQVWIGQDDETFGTNYVPGGPLPYVEGGDPTWQLVDLTGDGAADYVDIVPSPAGYLTVTVTSQSGSPLGVGPSVVGDGTINSPSQPYIADFTGDGKPDIAVIYNATHSTPHIAIFEPNRGYAQTTDVIDVDPGDIGVQPVATGDFDGDGKVDFLVDVVSNPNGSSEPAILYGRGDGTFAPPASLADFLATDESAFGGGDFDGDGRSDLLVRADAPGQPLYVLWSEGQNTFTRGPEVPSGGRLYDFNGDGAPDIFLGGGSQSDGLGQILFGDGARNFGRMKTLSDGDAGPTQTFYYSELFPADVDGDGATDIIWLTTPEPSGVRTAVVYLSTAKHPPSGPPNLRCTMSAADCALFPHVL